MSFQLKRPCPSKSLIWHTGQKSDIFQRAQKGESGVLSEAAHFLWLLWLIQRIVCMGRELEMWRSHRVHVEECCVSLFLKFFLSIRFIIHSPMLRFCSRTDSQDRCSFTHAVRRCLIWGVSDASLNACYSTAEHGKCQRALAAGVKFHTHMLVCI